jgi:ADP-dependent phosphofructokinase/glucokinase
MILSAVIAAQRAETGSVGNKTTFNSAKAISISEEGLAQMEALAKHISAPSNFMKAGIAEYSDYNVIFLPTTVVSDPVSTVGLGDTISSIAFLSE